MDIIERKKELKAELLNQLNMRLERTYIPTEEAEALEAQGHYVRFDKDSRKYYKEKELTEQEYLDLLQWKQTKDLSLIKNVIVIFAILIIIGNVWLAWVGI